MGVGGRTDVAAGLWPPTLSQIRLFYGPPASRTVLLSLPSIVCISTLCPTSLIAFFPLNKWTVYSFQEHPAKALVVQPEKLRLKEGKRITPDWRPKAHDYLSSNCLWAPGIPRV